MSYMDDPVDVFERHGYVLLDTGVTQTTDLPEAERQLERFGSLFRVFQRHPLWKPLKTDLERPPGRSSGIGENSLHIDCVNMENPPRVVALHCLRSDPAGGGASRLAPTSKVAEQPPEVLAVLREALFDEGQAYDLQHVGMCLERFSVLPAEDSGWVRWSGRLTEKVYSSVVTEALRATEATLASVTLRVMLTPGQTLVVDQRRWFHGRDALGPNQADLPEDARRLLVQCYIDPTRRLTRD